MIDYTLRPITKADDPAVCELIKTVGREFGAVGEGFGPGDAEVEAMSRHYLAKDRARYWVAECGGEIVGCGGIAAFNGSPGVCELRKLFVLPGYRGKGIGKALTLTGLEYAKSVGYQQCYLDTLANMTTAIALYQQLGFEHLPQPLGGTIHGGCDVWMIKTL